MKLGFVSDSLGGLSFDTLLDHAARLGVSGVEVNTGGCRPRRISISRP